MSWPIRNLLVTGIPRSGTSLVAALVDALEDTVCLSEPPTLWDVVRPETTTAATGAAGLIAGIEDFRRRLIAGELVVDRRLEDGRPPTDYFDPDPDQRGTLFGIATAFDDASLLGIKHNELFTAVLPELLAAGAPVIAIVRDPVPTILSWLANKLQIWWGQLPGGHLWPEYLAAARLDGDDAAARLAMAARTYECFAARYVAHRDQLVALLRYEDVLADPGIVARLAGRPAEVDLDVGARPHPDREASAEVLALCAALVQWAPTAVALYPYLSEP